MQLFNSRHEVATLVNRKTLWYQVHEFVIDACNQMPRRRVCSFTTD